MNGPTYPVMPIEQWRRLARTGGAPKDVLLRKADALGQVKATKGKDRTIAFTISTGAIDRDMDTIDVSGWDLRAYNKNPVVLWAHDHSALPIAKATEVTRGASRLLAKAEFATHEFADTVLQLLKDGFLSATSVGFRPTKFAFNEERRGVDFQEQELLEWSIVPVPANPEALIEASKKGLDLALVQRCFDGGCAPYVKTSDEDLYDVDEAWLRQQTIAGIHEHLGSLLKPVLDDALMWVTGRLPN